MCIQYTLFFLLGFVLPTTLSSASLSAVTKFAKQTAKDRSPEGRDRLPLQAPSSQLRIVSTWPALAKQGGRDKRVGPLW